MLLRVGIPNPNGGYVRAVRERGYPIMLSVAGFWNKKKARFRMPGSCLDGLDIFLDSGGFTALTVHGGYLWSAEEYVEQVARGSWSHWSAMDWVCPAAIANDDEEIRRRINETASGLRCCRVAGDLAGLAMPVPILQGHTPDQYERSAELTDRVLGGVWPELVGVGSVCGRAANEVIAIIERLDQCLPGGVWPHLFGVKSGALVAASQYARVWSSDSTAWNFAARMRCKKEGIPGTVAEYTRDMHAWYLAQLQQLERGSPQLQLDL